LVFIRALDELFSGIIVFLLRAFELFAGCLIIGGGWLITSASQYATKTMNLGNFTIENNLSIMRTMYRSLQAVVIAASFALFSLPVNAQKSEHEKEEIREREREKKPAKKYGVAQQPITKKVVPIAPPVEVNFTERANWDLAHPKTDFTMRNNEEKDHDLKFEPRKVGPNAKVTTIAGSKGTNASNGNNEKAGTNSPAPILSFNGILGDGSVIPPDIKLAAGLTYVMEVTNQSFAIYNKSTGALVSTVDLNTFFNFTATNANFLTDPHVLYDAPHGRFLAVIDAIIVGNAGTFLLAVSKTSDPTGAWYVYTVTGANSDLTNSAYTTLLDFPEMGYNQNWVVLTGDQFTATGNSTTDCIFVMNRASLYNGTLGTVTTFTDANSSQLSPAQTMDTTTLTEYMTQNYNGNSGGSGYVNIGTITGAVGSPTYTYGSQVGVTQPWNDASVMAVQKGSAALIDDDDTRISSSEYINGSLWFSHAVWLPATGTATYSAADWWQVNPAALTVTQFGRVTDGSSFYYYPNVYANAAGDAIMGYTVSSSTEYASAVYTFHAAADAANTMENLYTFQSGVSSYAPTGTGANADNRWGDFSGTAIDPVDNSFWVADGWANTNNNWATQIAHVATSAPITLPPVANFQANVTTSCTGTIQFTDLSSNTPTSWLWTFGDGGTSTVQNPTHTYLANGTYTVTLKATNAYGNNTKSVTGYITINEPAAPAATGASRCGSGSVTLSANTTNPVKWFNASGTIVSTSNPFVTPSLTQTTTYYVQDSVISPADSAGPVRNTNVGAGGYLNTTYGLNFDVLQAGTLQSVYLYAQAAGSITINVTNSASTVVNTATVSVPAGGSRVTLNFPLTVGTGYTIAWTGTGMSLYRNNAGAVYPYTDANGIVSITGNNAGTVPAYYYWFYDWYVTGPGCNSQSAAVTATITSGISAGTPTVTNVACNGGATGSVTITPSGGTPSYTYHWSNGQTAATLSGVVAGTYTVTVDDASGCSGTASETVTQPNALTVSLTATNSGCGSPNGSITSTVSGGTSTYTYHWSNAATTATVSNLSPATYTVTVTDSHQCTTTSSAAVNSSGLLNLSATQNNTNCSGGSTGSANVTVNGGTAPFTYTWSNGNTTASISGVTAGTYRITVSDNTGCSGTASVTISLGGAPSLTVSATNVSCFNAGTGIASVNVSGGTAPYSYSWNNGNTSASITNLNAGSYYLTVTDSRGCTTVDSAIITQPASITVFVSPVQPTCSGLSNGSASVTATGGTPSYTYNWSTNASGTSISNLPAGNYSVTLTDANHCTSQASFTVTDPTPVSASIVTNNDSCYGSADGDIQLTPAGGNSPYSYLWSNNATAATVRSLAAGNYSVTITDAHNCSATINAAVTQPAQLAVTTTATETTSGQSTGSASVGNVTGGTSPYQATWSNSQTGNTITNLAAGTYTVTVTDRNGCEATATAVVNTTVGINTINEDLSFTIYPNPAKTQVTVDAGSLDKETTVVLEDILGQSLLVKNITSSPVTVDLGSYSNGVYFIELRQGGKRAVKKFVINR